MNNESEKLRKELDELKEEFKKLESRNNFLEDKLENIESKFDLFEKLYTVLLPKQKIEEGERVLGFKIVQGMTSTNGNKYYKFYATKYIDGKTHRIYIGKDKDKAETKIREYCHHLGIEL